MLKNFRIKQDQVILIPVFVILFLFSAFRNGLGTDFYAYADYYNNPATFKDEFLFKFMFITVPRLISTNQYLFFIITSFVVSFFFLRTIAKHSQLIFLSLIIYVTQFYFISYNAVRQFIVIGIFFYFGHKLLANKKLLWYFILIIFLAQIHYSIYIMLLFPLLGAKNLLYRKYWIIWGISYVMFALQTANIIALTNIFSIIPNMSSVSAKFDMLQAGGDFFFGKYSSNYQLILKNVFFVCFLLRLKYFKNESNNYWLNLFLFGLIAQNILVKFSLFAVRIAYYGDIAQIMLVPVFINSFKNKNYRIALAVVFAVYFIYSFYSRFVVGGESEVFKHGVEWME